MKCVCFQSMDIASTKKVVKDYTTFKNVKLLMNVTISRHVKEDILKYARKFTNANTCMFGIGSAYSHTNLIQKQEHKDLTDKVLVLENTVSEMKIKLNYLENELKEVKKENVAKATVDNEVNESKNT